jgi:hypothetical protein
MILSTNQGFWQNHSFFQSKSFFWTKSCFFTQELYGFIKTKILSVKSKILSQNPILIPGGLFRYPTHTSGRGWTHPQYSCGFLDILKFGNTRLKNSITSQTKDKVIWVTKCRVIWVKKWQIYADFIRKCWELFEILRSRPIFSCQHVFNYLRYPIYFNVNAY